MGYFKDCRACGKVWEDRRAFLDDPDLHLAGYQVHFNELKTGMLLFSHSCRTTLAVNLDDFIDLYDGPVFSSRKLEPADCPQYCQNPHELRPCPVQCDCHFVREIIQIIKDWPKKATGQPDMDANFDLDENTRLKQV